MPIAPFRSCQLVMLLLAAAACGGGGGGAPPVPSASLSTLLADRAEAPANGTTEVVLLATVRDASGLAAAGRTLQFEADGVAVSLQPSTAVTDAAGLATARLTSGADGDVTVAVVVDPGGAAVRLQQTVTIRFLPLVPPVAQGIARYEDVDGDAAPSFGDRLVVPFSRAVTVGPGAVADVALPVAGDAFGAGARVIAGPADDEVTVELGTAPRLRTRGRFAGTALTANAPSGLQIAATPRIRSAFDGSALAVPAALDVAPGFAARPAALPAAALCAVGRFDLNERGDVLLVYGDTLQPWLDDGTGGYAPGRLLGLVPVRDVVAADLNGEPVDEVLTAHAFGVQVWNNQPFTAGESAMVAGGIVATGDCHAVLAADVSGDRFPDVVAGTAGGVVVAAHQRDVGNTFAITQVLPIGGPITALRAADLDGDGDPDVLAAIPAQDRALWLRNDGGVLVAGPQHTLAGARAVAVGDVDGNGRVDAVVAGAAAMRLFRATATGFDATDLGAVAAAADLVDVDGDTFPDLVLRFVDRIEVRLGDRSGGFLPFQTPATAAPAAAAVGDLDGDHDPDLVVAAATGTERWLGSLAGTFGTATFAPVADLGAPGVAAQVLGDLDRDGDVDRVVATATGLATWFGTGAGAFTSGAVFGEPGCVALALGDLDADGDLDLVAGRDGEDLVFANDGAGSFTLAQSVAPDTDTRAIAIGDLDGDGRPDLVLGNAGSNRILQNQTVGGVLQFVPDPNAFVLLPVEQIDRDTIGLALWDFDRDGDLDLFVQNGGTAAAPQDGLLLAWTALGFVLRDVIAAPWPASALQLGDVDGDGREDLLIGRKAPTGAQALHLHHGRADGVVKEPVLVPLPTPRVATAIALGDVDGDGRTDLALGDARSDRPILVLRQLPSGAFALVQSLPSLAVTGLHAVDCDRDGDLDLVTAEVDGPSRLLQNR